MEYMESKMQDRLEASMSEYEQMEEEIQTLREQLANGKRLLLEQMELTNERTKLCIELRTKVEVLVEALERLDGW